MKILDLNMSFPANLLNEFLSTQPHASQRDVEDQSEHEEDGMKIRDIKVDQTWIDRSKTFLELYFHTVEVDLVDQQYRSSDFPNFQSFLNFNSLHYFESIYLKADNRIIWLDSETVEKARQQTGDSIEQFLKKGGIMPSKNGYVQIINTFSKIKWLEILLGLGITQIIDSEGLLMSDTIDQIFADKIICLKFMLACYLSGLGKLVTSDMQLVEPDELRTSSFSAFPIGLMFDPSCFTVMQEWKNHILDHLASTIKFTQGETIPPKPP